MENTFTFYTFSKDLSVTQLVSLFYYNSPKDFSFKGESHDFWEFIYIDKGKMLITAGDKNYVLKAGELAFHKPGEFHNVRSYDQTPSSFIVAAFVCNSPCMKYFEHRILNLTGRERNYLYEALRCWQQGINVTQTPDNVLYLLPQHNIEPFGVMQLVQIYIELMLIKLLQRNTGVKITQRSASYAMECLYKELADNVIKYLEDSVYEKLTLKQIANHFGYSIPQMKKIFRIKMGCGIIDYFIDLKIEEAKRFMKQGEMNISQIALKLGYTDSSYFSRLFKSRCNMSPTEYCRSLIHETAS